MAWEKKASCLLVGIARTNIVVSYRPVKSLQFIWRCGTRWSHLWMTNLQMNCSDLTKWWLTNLVALVVGARVTCTIDLTGWVNYDKPTMSLFLFPVPTFEAVVISLLVRWSSGEPAIVSRENLRVAMAIRPSVHSNVKGSATEILLQFLCQNLPST